MSQAAYTTSAPALQVFGRRVGVADALVAAGASAAALGVAAASGGYFPTSWGWAALAMGWVAALALLLRRELDAGVLDGAFFGLLALFVGWIWASASWSHGASSSFLEGERALVALAGVAAALLLVSRRTVPQLLGGVAAGITLIAGYGLATRLFPERFGTFDPIALYRLQEPIGYWNALGIFSAIGVLLCLSFATRAATYLGRALAAGALAILLPTIYFTYSRGSWLALGIGLAAAIVLDPRRVQLTVGLAFLAPVPALEVWLGSRRDALTTQRSDLSAAVHDGKRYAVVVLVAALVSAAIAVLVGLAERRVAVPRVIRVAYGGVLALVLVGAVVGGLARYGSPTHIAERSWSSFKAPPGISGGNLNGRLFSLSGNGRVDLWRAAWHDYQANSVLGSGAGTYQQWWYEHRPYDSEAKDAHSLYFETLGELGPPGLALLGLALLVPVAGAVLARGQPLVPLALGAYVAYLAHAAVDWDWEVTAVTLVALVTGAALVAAARSHRPRPPAAWLRGGLAAGALAIAALSLVVLVGNLKLARAQHAAADKNWAKAAAEARSAADWAPWSARPLKVLGEVRLHEGRTRPAAATFREALDKDPHNSDLWYDLYLATEGTVADRAFATAVRLNPYGFDEHDRRAVLGRSSG
jgi:O-antigen ligase